jgi:hypothetical protein
MEGLKGRERLRLNIILKMRFGTTVKEAEPLGQSLHRRCLKHLFQLATTATSHHWYHINGYIFTVI